MIRYFIFSFLFSSLVIAQDSRDLATSPNEPPYISEEEWMEQNPEAQNINPAPISKSSLQDKINFHKGYRILEEKKDGYVVDHPLESKGLKKVKADGTHIYKKEKGAISKNIGLKLGSLSFANWQTTINSTNVSFTDVYGTAAVLFLDFDDYITKNYGYLSYKYSVNAVIANGNGVFADDGAESPEAYDLYLIPVGAGLTYRFQYSDTQFFVPYLTGGADFYLMAESREDGEFNATYSYGAHAAVGFLFQMESIMSDENDFQEDYEIQNLFLTIEARAVLGLDPDIDLTGNSIMLGFIAEL
ncbi:MAG: hypothetical protein AB8E15_10830 [Bdellovibrionales bacterium]